MATHVKVTKVTRDKLKILKRDLKAPSVGAVIAGLLDPPASEAEESSASGSDAEGRDEPVKRRRKDVREPLYSYEALAERRGMLQYYTGFDQNTVDLLIRRIREVRTTCLFCRSVSIHSFPAAPRLRLTLHRQVVQPEVPERRKSNEGFRKLDLEERVVMFLARIRRKVTFQELGYQYGCGKETARRYCNEMTKLFSCHLVPRLMFPLPPADLIRMRRPDVQHLFPDLLAILDATNWEQFKPQNFLENRLSYSAFKHMNAFQVLLGEWWGVFRLDCVDFAPCISRFPRKAGALALGNLWGHFQ